MTQPTKTLLNLLKVHGVYKLEQFHRLPHHCCAEKLKDTDENYSYILLGFKYLINYCRLPFKCLDCFLFLAAILKTR